MSVVALLLLYPWAGGCMWAGLGVDAVPDLSVLSLTGTRHKALG